jgi:hypothetical protein
LPSPFFGIFGMGAFMGRARELEEEEAAAAAEEA